MLRTTLERPLQIPIRLKWLLLSATPSSGHACKRVLLPVDMRIYRCFTAPVTIRNASKCSLTQPRTHRPNISLPLTKCSKRCRSFRTNELLSPVSASLIVIVQSTPTEMKSWLRLLRKSTVRDINGLKPTKYSTSVRVSTSVQGTKPQKHICSSC